jgi:hypothetical protein
MLGWSEWANYSACEGAQRDAAHAELGASWRPAGISANEEPIGAGHEQESFSVPLFAQAVLVDPPGHVLDAPVGPCRFDLAPPSGQSSATSAYRRRSFGWAWASTAAGVHVHVARDGVGEWRGLYRGPATAIIAVAAIEHLYGSRALSEYPGLQSMRAGYG